MYAVVDEQGRCTMLVQQWESGDLLKGKGHKVFQIGDLEELQILMIEVRNRYQASINNEKRNGRK